jgi:hypothetical protein
MQRTFIVSTFLLGAITFTQAEDTKKEMALMGWGAFTCAQFANMYRDDPKFTEEHFFNWAQGFMSGLNFATIGQGISMNLGSISTEQQQRAIRAYCNEHPLGNYLDAVLDLYNRFSLNKPVQKSN